MRAFLVLLTVSAAQAATTVDQASLDQRVGISSARFDAQAFGRVAVNKPSIQPRRSRGATRELVQRGLIYGGAA